MLAPGGTLWPLSLSKVPPLLSEFFLRSSPVELRRELARTPLGSSLVPRYSVNLDSLSSSSLLFSFDMIAFLIPLAPTFSPLFLVSVSVRDLLGELSLSPMISLWTLWIFLMGLLLVAAALVLGVLSTIRPVCSRPGLDLVLGGRVGDVLGDLRPRPTFAPLGLAYLSGLTSLSGLVLYPE